MATIIPFLRKQTAFDPELTKAMSTAFDAVCDALHLPVSDAHGRESVAAKIIELAYRGERDPVRLRDRTLADAQSA
ncbi:MAG: hypothetical protein ACRECV_03820 [Xanthobacteraceae bacterium]